MGEDGAAEGVQGGARERAGRPEEAEAFPVRLTDMERIKAWSCFDADSGQDLGVELREYFIPDFSHWKEHDQFEASFARLLKDLKGGRARAAVGRLRCARGLHGRSLRRRSARVIDADGPGRRPFLCSASTPTRIPVSSRFQAASRS